MIYHSKLLKRHIDLSHILSISDAEFINRMGDGGWFVGFSIQFQLQDNPMHFTRGLTRDEYVFIQEEDKRHREHAHHELAYLVGDQVVFDRYPPRNSDMPCGPPILAVVNLQKEVDELVAVWKASIGGHDPETDALRAEVASLEAMRPMWAQGYSSDSIAAQAHAAALSQIWQMLGVDNQTDATRAIRLMQGGVNVR